MLDKSRQAAIFQQLAEIGRALSNPPRLKMVAMLTQGEKPIDELATLTGQSLAAASANVKVLRNSHLVKTDKRGRSVYCTLADPHVAKLWLDFRDLGEIIVPEIREVVREEFDADESLSPLTMDDLHQKLGRGRFTLVDLRPPNEFAQGHLPNARNVPFASLSERSFKLPKLSPILVYCRGPYCAAAIAGTLSLREQQFDARRLRFSVPEWRAAGLEVASDGISE